MLHKQHTFHSSSYSNITIPPGDGGGQQPDGGGGGSRRVHHVDGGGVWRRAALPADTAAGHGASEDPGQGPARLPRQAQDGGRRVQQVLSRSARAGEQQFVS